jgi:hypothetical protein
LFPCLLWAQFNGVRQVKSSIDGQTLSFTEFIEALENLEEGTSTIISNVKIKFNLEIDKKGMDKWWSEGKHPITIKAHIGLQNCEFDDEYWLVIRDIHFKGYISFINCSNMKFLMKNCKFDRTVRFNANKMEFMEMDSCRLGLGLKIERTTVSDRLKFNACSFRIDTLGVKEERQRGFDVNDYLLQISAKTEPIDLTLSNCYFETPQKFNTNKKFFVGLSKSKFSGFRLTNCVFNSVVDISESNIENQFTTQRCKFNKGVLSSGMSMNQINSTIDWGTLKGNKLLIWDEKNKRFVNGLTNLGKKNEIEYSALISCYSNFYYTFKTQGNRFFSNECYVEWKNVETRQQYQLYTETRSTQAYFLYLMNLFLNDFCDYATNPIKAIFKSTWVILFFAFIYFISPIKIENVPRRSFYTQLALYADYLTSRKTLRETFHEHLNQFEQPYFEEDYRNLVKERKQEIPRFFQWFNGKIYYDKVFLWLEGIVYYLIDFEEKHWNELSRWQRWQASIFFFGLLLFSAVYFLFLRALDAVILSINVFSTLGFGEMRVKGLAMYLTVVEGFIGWFLLSIFSVALLNQVLQ